MIKIIKNILLFSLVLFIASCSKNGKEIPQIDVKTFFKNPDKINFKLSPSGDFISYLKPYKNRLNIYLRRVDSDSAIRVTSVKTRDINFYRWIDNETLVYAFNEKGDGNYHLIIVKKDGSGEKDITPFENTRAIFIQRLKNRKNKILIALNKRDKSLFDIYELNYQTGEYKLLEKNPGNVSSWLIDSEGKVRMAIQADGVNRKILYKKKGSKRFITLLTTDFRNEFSPIDFTADNRYLYAISNLNRDKAALVKYDPETNTEVEEIFSHPEVDIQSALISKIDNSLLAARYTTWKRHYKFFKPEWIEIDKTIKEQLNDVDYRIADRNDSEKLLLIRTYSDRTMGSYYLFDVDSMSLRKIAEISPWLNADYLSRVETIRFRARDGLLINGYLTLPVNKEPKNLPVIVNVHGGPWHRSTWGFDYVSQFFANRGYAVLDVNYRGSTGYGKKFFEAGFKEWGGKMQDDITDGVNWLLEQGIADPDRIGIFGFSFGGYAALMGLATTPNLYACGIDYSGIISVENLYESIPPYYKPFLQMMYEMIGDPINDKKLLKRISPINLVDKIRKPVLIAQGANDNKVKKSEVDKFVKKLRANGVEVEYILKENEGHVFMNEENRIELFERIEKFLSKNMKKESL